MNLYKQTKIADKQDMVKQTRLYTCSCITYYVL